MKANRVHSVDGMTQLLIYGLITSIIERGVLKSLNVIVYFPISASIWSHVVRHTCLGWFCLLGEVVTRPRFRCSSHGRPVLERWMLGWWRCSRRGEGFIQWAKKGNWLQMPTSPLAKTLRQGITSSRPAYTTHKFLVSLNDTAGPCLESTKQNNKWMNEIGSLTIYSGGNNEGEMARKWEDYSWHFWD